ncbi:MAG TPA: GntR family transcriptional regulator [candidate division Zixibacteria bacterium]|nr:GntR family transcriptional regulator [candidate division Zixibacteria bacterium]
MQQTIALDRPNLSEDIAEKLREMIVDGSLEAERINEVHLARQLGVSRTPLREALMRLEAEGAVVSQPRYGFSVRPLSADEVEQIYPIRAILDPEALKAAGLPSQKSLAQLKRLNDRLMEATTPESIVTLDDKWHLELLAHCPNETLLNLIRQFMGRIRRYELALMRDRRVVENAFRDHADIIGALEKGNLSAACEALEQNLESGKTPILEWLRQCENK